MRNLYRYEADCQIIHDSILRRGLANAYLIEAAGRIAGYGGIWNKYHEGRVMEFYTTPSYRGDALLLFRDLLNISNATAIEAQTNMPLMTVMLFDCARNVQAENILFHDAFTSSIACPDVLFRRAALADTWAGDDEWVLETDETVVAKGGFLLHYNPPYGDIYMETAKSRRRQGYGAYIVQMLKQACYEAGSKPAARCDPDNEASRRTLQKAGMLPCGYLLAGEVDRSAR